MYFYIYIFIYFRENSHEIIFFDFFWLLLNISSFRRESEFLSSNLKILLRFGWDCIKFID